ncbi:hypothetical protein VOI54_07270 [Tamlana sp. 2201CG12-4]|uniref:hypothetical protein n=1 Tax=Tamlana sp. 2201CG12-4 TaxID=3112582 RepID=UPI002DBD6FF1|nr:hypothetical protein [Tamlana sp. 2201CG12-4]MEC3906814.1 hypothetical protein [Tamlana sp. 2201CG12-4]
MKYIKLLFVLGILISCSEDKDDEVQASLATYIQGRNIEMGAVIACAASDPVSGQVLTFYYPESGATDIRLYQTDQMDLDENNLSHYTQVLIQNMPFFNGYLGKYEQNLNHEKWCIVTFELDDEIKISNPIRFKQILKPTLWNDLVTIDQSQSGMPDFTWEDNPVGDNAIYFQVISDAQNNLLSGTYTYQNQFQYYKTDNVVLNITTQIPPDLILGTGYNFTLMDVSEDNWVNWVVQKQFISE